MMEKDGHARRRMTNKVTDGQGKPLIKSYFNLSKHLFRPIKPKYAGANSRDSLKDPPRYQKAVGFQVEVQRMSLYRSRKKTMSGPKMI
jgi:hypothetical protein